MMRCVDDWFTVEKIDENTYAISEYKHWEETHCYLICGNQRAALIDTGLGVSNIRTIVERLTDLPVVVLTTHAHWDHIGGHGLFEHISVHKAEESWLSGEFPLPLQVVKNNLTCKQCGFPEDFCVEEYSIFNGKAQTILNDGDWVDLGDRKLRVIHTPGHSPGHCCFYEPERKYLYTGDLVYKGCLDIFYPTTDPTEFYTSIKRIQEIPAKRILPGHYQLDIERELIDEIEAGLSQLKEKRVLKKGTGVFDFGDFQIHI